jgi:hypothetical protein
LEVEEFEMLDASFVEAIKRIAEGAVNPVMLDIGDNARVIVAGGKILTEFTKDEPFGKLDVAEFDSFVTAAKTLIEVAEQSVVTVSDKRIYLCCDGAKPHKRASVELKFQLTAAYDCLLSWEANPRTVQVVNKMLRTKLVGTYEDYLTPIFKQVEFARAGATTIAKAGHRDTMGKSVDNAVRSSAGDIPEVITFNTQLLLNAPCKREKLAYSVEVDHAAETIGLAQIGDIAAQSMRETVSELVATLTQELPKALVVAS